MSNKENIDPIDNMTHSFVVSDAKKYGERCATILNHFRFWLAKNHAHKEMIKDGRVWMYTTLEGLERTFPYMTRNQIRHAIKKLETSKELIKGYHSGKAFDRTLWYSIKGFELAKPRICEKSHIEVEEVTDAGVKSHTLDVGKVTHQMCEKPHMLKINKKIDQKDNLSLGMSFFDLKIEELPSFAKSTEAVSGTLLETMTSFDMVDLKFDPFLVWKKFVLHNRKKESKLFSEERIISMWKVWVVRELDYFGITEQRIYEAREKRA